MSDQVAAEFLRILQTLTTQGADTARAVADLGTRFEKLETRIYAPGGMREDLRAVQDKLVWAKGWIAGWIAAISLAASGVTLLTQWLFKKFGG